MDDPPHQVDDAASTASQESRVTPPMVVLPLNQDLIDANLTVEQLQTFQHVDNVVEVQLQPISAPPPSTTIVDSSFFDRVSNMMNTFDKLVPLLSNLGSARRSPTAGPSDIVSPNPIDRVPDTPHRALMWPPRAKRWPPDLHRPLRSRMLPVQAFRSSVRTSSPPHVVSRTRETSPEGVTMPPLRIRIA